MGHSLYLLVGRHSKRRGGCTAVRHCNSLGPVEEPLRGLPTGATAWRLSQRPSCPVCSKRRQPRPAQANGPPNRGFERCLGDAGCHADFPGVHDLRLLRVERTGCPKNEGRQTWASSTAYTAREGCAGPTTAERRASLNSNCAKQVMAKRPTTLRGADGATRHIPCRKSEATSPTLGRVTQLGNPRRNGESS
jgi:hypothetical protein